MTMFGLLLLSVEAIKRQRSDARTPPVSIANSADTAPIPPRPPDGIEGDSSPNMANKGPLCRTASTDSGDAEEPKLIIAESESCDSHSSNSNSESFRYKGPKKRFLEGLKTDSSSGPMKPKTSFNLRHCINQIIDSDVIRNRLLSKEDSPGVSQISSPSITASASLDNTPVHSPNPAPPRPEPVPASPSMNIASATPTIRAGVKVRDIIQESVTASVCGISNQSENKSNEKGGNPLLQMAALASMLPRQMVPGREGMPVTLNPGQAAVPLAATPKPELYPRTFSEAAPRQPGLIQHRQYAPPQPEQRYYAQEPVTVISQPQQQPKSVAPGPPRLEQAPARYPGPPPLLVSPSPKHVEKARVPASAGHHGAYVNISAKPQQYRNASPKQQPNAQSHHYPAPHPVASAAAAAAAVVAPPKTDMNAAVIVPGAMPLVAGYVYPSQAAPFSAVSMTVEKETPLDLSKKTTIEEEPIIISDDQPLDLSVKPTRPASHSSPRTHPYPQHSQGSVVKAAQTWYPHNQSGSSQNLSSRFGHSHGHAQDQRSYPSGSGTPGRHADPNMARFQNVNRPFKTADPNGRPLAAGMSPNGNQVRPGYGRPMVAEVRPIVSQTKGHPSHSRQMYHSEKGRVVSPHAAGMQQASYASHGCRTHSPSHSTHSSLSHSSGYASGSHSPGRSSVSSYSPSHSNMHRTTPTGLSQGQGHMLQGHPGHAISPQGHPMPSPQEQFLRQVAQHRDVQVTREMLSPRDQQMNMAIAMAPMRPRSSSTSSLLGNHPVDDILYLKCNVCNSTYGSLHSFKKHFSKAHEFEPRPDHVTVRSISEAKEISKADAPQISEAKYQYSQAGGQPPSPSYRASPTGSNLSSPGASAMEHTSPGPLVSQSPHNRHQELAKSDPAKLENTPPTGASKSGRTVMQCFQCGQDFPTRDWGVFKRHMRAHEMPQLRCNICRQSFRDEQEFRDHNLTYHPVQNYPCRTCGVSFGHPTALSKHVRTVHAESLEPDAPNLQCLYCPHSFNSLADLKTHIQEHERLLGISSKDSGVAQHSPQIRRASPDSTNDLEQGQMCPEEKPAVSAPETGGTNTAASKSRSQGIPIFNLNQGVRAAAESGDSSFRNMSIMDIVREKVEEASRRYLFDMCNKNEDKEGATKDEGSKEIAIKQEVSMEVKQEIGDKVYVMNYQEKGTVKESHIEEPATKGTGLKIENENVKESDHKDAAQSSLGDNVFLSKNDSENNSTSQSQDVTSYSSILAENGTGIDESKTSPDAAEVGNMSKNDLNRSAESSGLFQSANESGATEIGQKMEYVNDSVPIDGYADLDSQKVVSRDSESLSLNSDTPQKYVEASRSSEPTKQDLHNGVAEKQQEVARETVSPVVAPSVPPKPSNAATPAALMFDDSDMEDDDDGGSKLVICDDTDADDKEEVSDKPKSPFADVSAKRPLHEDGNPGSPKRLKPCKDNADCAQS